MDLWLRAAQSINLSLWTACATSVSFFVLLCAIWQYICHNSASSLPQGQKLRGTGNTTPGTAFWRPQLNLGKLQANLEHTTRFSVSAHEATWSGNKPVSPSLFVQLSTKSPVRETTFTINLKLGHRQKMVPSITSKSQFKGCRWLTSYPRVSLRSSEQPHQSLTTQREQRFLSCFPPCAPKHIGPASW